MHHDRTTLVAYRRVSTKGQGDSGLGLEAQELAIARHAERVGARMLGEFTEVESGRRPDRPELARALAMARRARATLVVAKLDRLSRNVAFLSALMESGVEFVACDQPDANRLTLHILAAVAEDEARQASERTRAALAAYKARGGRLGTDNLTPEGRARGSRAGGEAVRAAAAEADAHLWPILRGWVAEGAGHREIARRLDADGHRTRTGKPWSGVQVGRVIRRID